MLFGYPVAATQNNWLHDCLSSAVCTIHAAIAAGRQYPKWPNVLPKSHREKLKSRRALRDRLKEYDFTVRQLTDIERDEILNALHCENRIAELLSGASTCATIDELPVAIREPVERLFDCAFELLTDFGVRDQQYERIYTALTDHVCPFCGTENFDAPGAPRVSLDHYLTKSRYTFAAANLCNLVPMGDRCNSRYKMATDLLRRADGSRRVAFDPYNHTTLSVSLDDSQPFKGANAHTPNWQIRFAPDTPEVATWDEVFSVRERYRRDNLDPHFPRWLALFRAWARSKNLHARSDTEFIAALGRYAESWTIGGIADCAFLKAAVFRMLHGHCQAGNKDLLLSLRSLTEPIENFPAE